MAEHLADELELKADYPGGRTSVRVDLRGGRVAVARTVWPATGSGEEPVVTRAEAELTEGDRATVGRHLAALAREDATATRAGLPLYDRLAETLTVRWPGAAPFVSHGPASDGPHRELARWCIGAAHRILPA